MIKNGVGEDVALVSFELPSAVSASSVTVCGDFNDWSPDAQPLTRTEDGGFRTVIELPTGRRFRFRYLIDGERWENDWAADDYIPNGFGTHDSVVDLTTGVVPTRPAQPDLSIELQIVNEPEVTVTPEVTVESEATAVPEVVSEPKATPEPEISLVPAPAEPATPDVAPTTATVPAAEPAEAPVTSNGARKTRARKTVADAKAADVAAPAATKTRSKRVTSEVGDPQPPKPRTRKPKITSDTAPEVAKTAPATTATRRRKTAKPAE